MSPFVPHARRLRLALLLGGLLVGGASWAAQATYDFSGAWRLDDRQSDGAEQLGARMQQEARQEAAPQLPSGQADNSKPGGGGNSGGHGRLGGMGGGHGHGGRGQHSNDKPAADSGPAPASYPLPPLLAIDSLLLVEQDAQRFKVSFDNGEQLAGRLQGPAQASLNGSAMVTARNGSDGLHLSVRYPDGASLDEHWMHSPDGRQLYVFGEWKPALLQHPVSFKRVYVALQ